MIRAAEQFVVLWNEVRQIGGVEVEPGGFGGGGGTGTQFHFDGDDDEVVVGWEGDVWAGTAVGDGW